MKVRTRFAPSPTGFMHIGNLRTALYAYLFAKSKGGQFVLRIEDTDQERFVEGAVDVIYNTMRKAGLYHDEGPDIGGAFAPYVQSERKPMYKQYAEKLVGLGGAYYCFCTKERLETLTDENGIRKYDKHCLSLSAAEIEEKIKNGEKYVIRQNIPTDGTSEYNDLVFGKISVENKDLEDNILLKSDGMPTYNFANVVDDHLMEINYVIRGTEYLSSTPKYNLVYKGFGWQEPKYMHLPPIMKDAQRKLSKRYGDANFEDFIAKGYLTEAIINYIALLGWSPKGNVEKMSMSQLTELFSIDGISKSGSIFDEAKMKWLNSQYIKDLSLEKFNEMAKPFYDSSKICGKYDYMKFSKLLHSRVEILSDIPSMVNFIEEYEQFSGELYFNKKMNTNAEMAKDILEQSCEFLSSLEIFDDITIHDAIVAQAEKMGNKKGIYMWCMRVALSGRAVTPGGGVELASILGKEESIKRIKAAISFLN